MKQPWNWDETDLQTLIRERVPESITLDYKQSAALDRRNPKKRDDLSKDVSAFANSAGGVLVYGIAEAGDTHLPDRLDEGIDPTDITKEWIEQVIHSSIQRRVDGVLINYIALSHSPGNVAVVVSIPQSTRAPHQAWYKRFYKRFNFSSVPMEEYEVRDTSRRLSSPDLSLVFSAVANDGRTPLTKLASGQKAACQLNIHVRNESPTPAEFCLFRLYIDTRLMAAAGYAYGSVELKDRTVPVAAIEVEWRGHNRLPIWNGIFLLVTNFGIHILDNSITYYLFWDAQAPMMERKVGSVVVGIEDDEIRFRNEPVDWRFIR